MMRDLPVPASFVRPLTIGKLHGLQRLMTPRGVAVLYAPPPRATAWRPAGDETGDDAVGVGPARAALPPIGCAAVAAPAAVPDARRADGAACRCLALIGQPATGWVIRVGAVDDATVRLAAAAGARPIVYALDATGVDDPTHRAAWSALTRADACGEAFPPSSPSWSPPSAPPRPSARAWGARPAGRAGGLAPSRVPALSPRPDAWCVCVPAAADGGLGASAVRALAAAATGCRRLDVPCLVHVQPPPATRDPATAWRRTADAVREASAHAVDLLIVGRPPAGEPATSARGYAAIATATDLPWLVAAPDVWSFDALTEDLPCAATAGASGLLVGRCVAAELAPVAVAGATPAARRRAGWGVRTSARRLQALARAADAACRPWWVACGARAHRVSDLVDWPPGGDASVASASTNG